MRLLVFFRFPPGISLSAKGRPRPKWPNPPPLYLAISCPSRSGRPKRKMCKSCATFGRNVCSGWIPPPKVPLACVFSVFGPEFLPKWPKTPVFRNFTPLEVRSAKTQAVKKMRIFFPFRRTSSQRTLASNTNLEETIVQHRVP